MAREVTGVLVLVQYFSGAQPVVVINDAELARYVIMRNLSQGSNGNVLCYCLLHWLNADERSPCRLVSLRLSTRHEFRGPASLFTGKEKEFNKSGLFSTNE